MNLHILAIGKKKSEYDPMIAEYQKRIVAPFSLSFEIIEPFGNDNPALCREKESEKLVSKIKPGDYVIALDEHGRDMTTQDFAGHLDKQLQGGAKRIVFIIGGAYGLDQTVRDQASFVMRIGSFTFPHELVRLLITEQLYRATNFLAGGKYHHV